MTGFDKIDKKNYPIFNMLSLDLHDKFSAINTRRLSRWRSLDRICLVQLILKIQDSAMRLQKSINKSSYGVCGVV